MTNPYPSAAGDGTPHGTQAVAPPEVQTAFKIYIVNIVIGVIGVILAFILLPSLLDAAIAKQGDVPGLSADQLRAAGQAGAIGGVIFGLVLLALYLLFVFLMRNGRNWARIVLTVLSAISIISTLLGIGSLGTLIAVGGLGVVSAILNLVQLVLLVAAIYFMFRPASNAYFGSARRA